MLHYVHKDIGHLVYIYHQVKKYEVGNGIHLHMHLYNGQLNQLRDHTNKNKQDRIQNRSYFHYNFLLKCKKEYDENVMHKLDLIFSASFETFQS